MSDGFVSGSQRLSGDFLAGNVRGTGSSLVMISVVFSTRKRPLQGRCLASNALKTRKGDKDRPYEVQISVWPTSQKIE